MANIGRVSQVIGPAVDVEFDEGKQPPIHTGAAHHEQGLQRARSNRCDRGSAAASWRGTCSMHRAAAHGRHGARHAGGGPGGPGFDTGGQRRAWPRHECHRRAGRQDGSD